MKRFLKYLLLFFIFIIPIKSFAQNAEKLKADGFKERHIDRVEYSNEKTTFFIKEKYRYNSKVIYLGLEVNDSVSIYLNDSLVYSKYISDSGKHYYGPSRSITIPFDKKKKDKIIISLNLKKEYIQFDVKKKYYVIRVYFDDTENYWIMVQNNNLPWE